MKKLKAWCKRCFGIKTTKERMREELKDCYHEVYMLQKNIDWDKAQLFYRERRIELILSVIGVEK